MDDVLKNPAAQGLNAIPSGRIVGFCNPAKPEMTLWGRVEGSHISASRLVYRVDHLHTYANWDVPEDWIHTVMTEFVSRETVKSVP